MSSNSSCSQSPDALLANRLQPILLTGEDWGSGTIIVLVNVAIIPLGYVMASRDASSKAKEQEVRHRLYSKLGHAQVEDRRNYDVA